jgi:hypothetical protein
MQFDRFRLRDVIELYVDTHCGIHKRWALRLRVIRKPPAVWTGMIQSLSDKMTALRFPPSPPAPSS